MGGGCEQSEQTEGLKKKEASPIYVNPSVNPPYGVLPAPQPGSLLDSLGKFAYSEFPAPSKREPFGALYKLTD